MKELHEQLYRQIPGFKCKSGCHACCGPVPLSKWEASLLKDGVMQLENSVNITAFGSGATCRMVNENGCSKYESRPLLCRLFGTVKGMTCPHGCRPAFLLSEEQEKDIVRKYAVLMEVK